LIEIEVIAFGRLLSYAKLSSQVKVDSGPQKLL